MTLQIRGAELAKLLLERAKEVETNLAFTQAQWKAMDEAVAQDDAESTNAAGNEFPYLRPLRATRLATQQSRDSAVLSLQQQVRWTRRLAELIDSTKVYDVSIEDLMRMNLTAWHPQRGFTTSVTDLV